MKVRILAVAISPLLLCLSPSSTLAADGSFKFTIGTTDLKMPIPLSYCTPTGKDVDRAAATAKADPDNITLATFVACKAPSGGIPWDRYVLVKVPRSLVEAKFDKRDFLVQMNQVFTGPSAPSLDEKTTQDIATNTEKALGQRIEVRGSYGYDGRDDDCIYLAGPLRTETKGKQISGQLASCISVSGGKAFVMHVYEFPASTPLAELKARARKMALSVRP